MITAKFPPVRTNFPPSFGLCSILKISVPFRRVPIVEISPDFLPPKEIVCPTYKRFAAKLVKITPSLFVNLARGTECPTEGISLITFHSPSRFDAYPTRTSDAFFRTRYV